MRQQKDYIFINEQIILMVWLSMAPGIAYVFFGAIFNVLLPALLWYISIALTSVYGIYLYRVFDRTKMNPKELNRWYVHTVIFLYIIFSLWSVIFILYVQESENNLHYIAIFTQLGASVVASTLLVFERRIFIPILFVLMVPLILYFMMIGEWYGYVLSLFSSILLGVLVYAANNSFKLIQTNYYNANHDVLTGLYNRRYFIEFMESLSQRSTDGMKIYMVLIDLDHFKSINDSLGHDVGDEVLIEVANRIKSFCERSDVVARLGGDEFIVVSQEYQSGDAIEDYIESYAEGVLNIIKKPYLIGDHHLYLSASIGLNMIKNQQVDPNKFLKEADIAMYEAKESGRDGVILFNRELEKRVAYKLKVQQRLHFAIQSSGLEVYYQPQLNGKQRLIGCEALIRWEDETLGLVSPEEFIPVAENTGQIIELGRYVLMEVFSSLREWDQQGMPIDQVSVNISVRQLFYSNFVDQVAILAQSYLNERTKHKVVFEITESVFAEDFKKVTEVLSKLKHLGISFSMDDFGTGYSSLNYLRSLPVDELKIDRTFIEHMLDSGTDKMMVTTILSIARNFGLKVVIEGIENEKQFLFLADYKCYAYQGYYFSKPMNKTDFEAKYLVV